MTLSIPPNSTTRVRSVVHEDTKQEKHVTSDANNLRVQHMTIENGRPLGMVTKR